ncbi:MAG: ABC transporter permease, partial [Candidatus Korarchaeum sp.]
SRMRSPEGFQLVANLLMLPLIFLSGAFYPISNLPQVVKPLFYLNPLTYSVDLVRYLMVGISAVSPTLDVLILAVMASALSLVSARMFNMSTLD